MYLPQCIRLQTLEIYIQESAPSYMRRGHDTRAVIRYMKDVTYDHADFRLFRSMRTVQGLDNLFSLRGMKYIRFRDFTMWLAKKEKVQIRDHQFLSYLNSVVTIAHNPAAHSASLINRLKPVPSSYVPTAADYCMVKWLLRRRGPAAAAPQLTPSPSPERDGFSPGRPGPGGPGDDSDDDSGDGPHGPHGAGIGNIDMPSPVPTHISSDQESDTDQTSEQENPRDESVFTEADDSDDEEYFWDDGSSGDNGDDHDGDAVMVDVNNEDMKTEDDPVPGTADGAAVDIEDGDVVYLRTESRPIPRGSSPQDPIPVEHTGSDDHETARASNAPSPSPVPESLQASNDDDDVRLVGERPSPSGSSSLSPRGNSVPSVVISEADEDEASEHGPSSSLRTRPHTSPRARAGPALPSTPSRVGSRLGTRSGDGATQSACSEPSLFVDDESPRSISPEDTVSSGFQAIIECLQTPQQNLSRAEGSALRATESPLFVSPTRENPSPSAVPVTPAPPGERALNLPPSVSPVRRTLGAFHLSEGQERRLGSTPVRSESQEGDDPNVVNASDAHTESPFWQTPKRTRTGNGEGDEDMENGQGSPKAKRYRGDGENRDGDGDEDAAMA